MDDYFDTQHQSYYTVLIMKYNPLKTDDLLDKFFYVTGWIVISLALFAGIAWKMGWFHLHFPPCILHSLTGYYCPGCGGTRAVKALLHGHIFTSLYYHPIVAYTAVVGGWFMISQTISRLSHGKRKGMHYRDVYMWIALAIVVVNCLVKNLILALTGTALMS